MSEQPTEFLWDIVLFGGAGPNDRRPWAVQSVEMKKSVSTGDTYFCIGFAQACNNNNPFTFVGADVEPVTNLLRTPMQGPLCPQTTCWHWRLVLAPGWTTADPLSEDADGAGGPIFVNAPANFGLTVVSNNGVVKDTSGGPPGSEIDCGIDCDESYPASSSVTIEATPNGGFVFDHWELKSGAIDFPDDSNNPLTLLMDRAWLATAIYTGGQAINITGLGAASVLGTNQTDAVIEAIPAPDNYLVSIICPP